MVSFAFGLVLENGVVVLVSALTGMSCYGVEYFGVLLALWWRLDRYVL